MLFKLAVSSLLVFACDLPARKSANHVFLHVTFAVSAQSVPVSGRLLVFMKQGKGDKEVSVDEFHPTGTWVAAKEVRDLAPGSTVELDGTEEAFPASFSSMPSGDWEAQAVLDPDHTYNYSGRGPADWIGPMVSLEHWSPAGPNGVSLEINGHPAEDPHVPAMRERTISLIKPGSIERQELLSPSLTHFWGKATSVRAYVVLPPSYVDHPNERFPTVYWTHGFGGQIEYALSQGATILKRMQAGTMPPMIWVMLDESCPQGAHEFADSVNDGPWGTALTREFIPMLEQRYRMDAKPQGRLLNGHSSGGWATLQLQVNYSDVFGGTWSTSPDPSDFHDFTGPDLYATHANMYRRPDGTPWPIMRDKGKVLATLEQFTHLEDVLGSYSGQVRSFDYVFSPRSASGEPEFMFDHVTGDVHPEVVAYWHDHYDLANIVESNWPERRASLTGRIHLIVGTADTFYLDGAAHKFEARLNALGAEPHFTYSPNRTHFDLYGVGSDRDGLFDQIAAEMYAVARPGKVWKHAP